MAGEEIKVMGRNFGGAKAAALLLFAAIWMAVAPAGEARADYDQSKRWFDAQSHSSRSALQDALYWSGDYFGPIDARFGSQTYASLVAFQRRAGLSPTGVLRRSDRADLLDEAARIRQLVYYHSRRSGGRMSAPVYQSPGYALASPTLILP